MTADHKAAFQYSEEWIENGFPISPFSLPLKKQVFVPTKDYFDGLFGVFADSLPDNWGRLLLDRLLRAHKQNPDKLTVLDLSLIHIWSQQWHIHSGLYCLHGMMFRRLQSLDSSIPCAV